MRDGDTYQVNDPGPKLVTVPPGEAVYFGFGYVATNGDGNTNGCVAPASARVQLPGSDVWLTAPVRLGTPICPSVWLGHRDPRPRRRSARRGRNEQRQTS